MSKTTDLDHLRTLTLTQLRRRWTAERCAGDPPHFKHALIQGIAQRMQTRSRSGLDAETRRLLTAAMRSAPPPARSRKRPATKRRTRPALRPDTTLLRDWGGETHRVRVLGPRRFRYRDRDYASLSEIAREITGARWSGPRFFGLKKAQP